MRIVARAAIDPPALLLGSPRDDAGNLIMLGTGQQHRSTTHVADLADFYRRVLESDSARGYYVIGDGLNPTRVVLWSVRRQPAAPGASPNLANPRVPSGGR
jgi:hypothetical protein